MKNINDLNVGQGVVYSSNKTIWTVGTINTETGQVSIYVEGTDITRDADVKEIFPVTEHVLKDSKLINETRDAAKAMIPFGVKINDKIMNKSFLNHWIEMCNAEGEEKEFETAKAKFNLFIAALTSSLETLDCLKVLGIPLLAQMIPDLDEEN